MWKEPPPPKVRKWRKRNRKWIGPLAGDGNWFEDPVRRNKHRELTRAGMERARQEGKLIGVLPVEEREGFAEKFTPVLAQLEQKAITRRQAAQELDISGPTLKRVLDNHLAATQRTFTVDEERTVLVAEGVGLTESLNIKP